jgi:hypothetical protein
VGADNSVMGADLAYCAERGVVGFGIWLRGGLTAALRGGQGPRRPCGRWCWRWRECLDRMLERPPTMNPNARVLRRDRLGGLIREYAQLARVFGTHRSVVVVVETAGDDGDHVRLDIVDEPVLLGYPA